MTLQPLDRSVLVLRLAQIAQPTATYDSKTAQTDQHIEIAKKFGDPPGQKLTRLHRKLTSGTAQRLHPGVRIVGVPISAHARPGDGALPP